MEAPAPPGADRSAAVELDDQLLLDRELDVLAGGHAEHSARDVLGIQFEPFRNTTAAGGLDAGPDERILPAGFLDPDHLTGLHLVRRDRDLATVHQHMAMADELTRLGGGRAGPEAGDHGGEA